MSFELQLGLVIVLAAGGIVAGRRFAVRPRYWLLGFLLPLLVVALVILGRRVISLSFVPPFSWVTSGQVSFAVMAPVCTMIFSTLIPRLAIARQRFLVTVFMLAMLLNFSVLPLVMPMAVRASLLARPIRIDKDGVCRQTTEYTCGPAAAVTALRRVGIDTTESEIAILAQTNPASGTDPDLLAAAINHRFGSAGVHAQYRPFGSMDELGCAVPAVALMSFSLFVDHYVAVLEVTPTGVVVGDPLGGRSVWSRAEFAKKWRGAAVTVAR